ncbi:unnamed protein product, partial [Staurois parvus]
MSAVSGHLLYYVRSLWSSPVLCLQSLVISRTMSAVSGHLLYYVRSLWSFPVLCLQSLVISYTMSAVSGHLLYYVCSPLVQNIFFSCFPPLKSRYILWSGASYGAKYAVGPLMLVVLCSLLHRPCCSGGFQGSGD